MNALRSLYATTYAIILLAFTTGEATSDSSYNVPIQPRIVGGKPVSLNRFPSFTFTGGNILCGGSLIHEVCVMKFVEQLSVDCKTTLIVYRI